jgi:hypothetical protein
LNLTPSNSCTTYIGVFLVAHAVQLVEQSVFICPALPLEPMLCDE